MSNLILIGMPGAGKSTLGVQLAKKLGMDFVDTDVLIQISENTLLHKILEDSDFRNLRRLEEAVLVNLDLSKYVIATGGSAVHSDAGMNRLKSLGPVIFLDVQMDELLNRIGDYSQRGIASDKSQSFADIYDERSPLYRKHADVIIDCSGRSQSDLLEELASISLGGEI